MRRLLALTLLALTTAGLPLLTAGTATGAASAPPPGAPAGWRLVHTDEFNGTRLGRIWGKYDAPHGGPAASYYSPDQVVVSGGLLRLRIAARPAGGRPYATGAVGSWGLVQTYGRYEYRAKAPLGKGMDAYVTLWPQSQAGQQATFLEILARPGAEKIYLSNEYGSGESNRTLPGRFSDAFHTYTIEWSPKSFRVLIDGRVRMTDSHVSRERKWIGFALSSGDPLTGLPGSATRIPNEFQIDWVRIFAYDPKAPGTAPAPPAKPTPTPAKPTATPTVTATPALTPSTATPSTATAAGAGGGSERTVTAENTAAEGSSGRLLGIGGAALLAIGGAALAFTVVRRSRRPDPGPHHPSE